MGRAWWGLAACALGVACSGSGTSLAIGLSEADGLPRPSTLVVHLIGAAPPRLEVALTRPLPGTLELDGIDPAVHALFIDGLDAGRVLVAQAAAQVVVVPGARTRIDLLL